MISRERIHKFRIWRRRRNRAGLMDARHDLGTRCCSCLRCDPHKLTPNKQRRAREKAELLRSQSRIRN
jgi:hypothetical protein